MKVRRYFKPKTIFLLTIIVFIVILYLMTVNNETTLNRIKIEVSLTIPENRTRIYALETSSKNDLNYVQACSLECAAKLNSNMDVVLLMRGMDETTLQSRTVKELLSYNNFKIEKMNVSQILSDTKLEKWYLSAERSKSPYQLEHLSDALRYAVIYKNGGIYMDLDVYFLKALQFSNNFIALSRTSDGGYLPENHFFGFKSPGHPVLDLIISRFESEYVPTDYLRNGPKLLWTAAEIYCLGKEVTIESYALTIPDVLKSDCDVKVEVSNNTKVNSFRFVIPYFGDVNFGRRYGEGLGNHHHARMHMVGMMPVIKGVKSPFVHLMSFSCPKIYSIISNFEFIVPIKNSTLNFTLN